MKQTFQWLLACLAAMALSAGQSTAAPLFAPSYNADVVFQDQLGGTTMTLTYNGTNYWSSSGGGPGGVRYAQYDGSGNPVATFSPGLDFRSVFSSSLGSGGVFARQYNNNTIYQQTSPGVFVPSGISLAGLLDSQSAVIFNGAGTEFVAMDNGTVRTWDLSGNVLSTVALSGWGAVAGETDYPADRGIAAAGDYWFTYSDGILSAWDTLGNRVDQTILNGAGTSFDSHFSLSYANDRIFIVDAAGGNWRGYNIGVFQQVPEPTSLALFSLMMGIGGIALARRRRRTH